MHKTNSVRLHGKPTEEFITALLKTPEYDKICELKNQLHGKIGFIKSSTALTSDSIMNLILSIIDSQLENAAENQKTSSIETELYNFFYILNEIPETTKSIEAIITSIEDFIYDNFGFYLNA
jgi:hypothetical protein